MTRQRLEYHQIIREHLSTAYLLPEEKIETVLPRFLASLQDLIQDLERTAETESREALGRAGHTMKGALLNLGLKELAAIAFVLEQSGRTADLEQDCAQIIAELKKEITKFV